VWRCQEDRIKKSIERSKAPVQKKTGKPVMFRAPPMVAPRTTHHASRTI
jgi:hypothetical protein